MSPPPPSCLAVALRLAVTTLEEVFLRLAEQVEMQEQQAAAAAADAARAEAAGKDLGAPRPAKRSMDLSKLGRHSGRFSTDAAGHLAVDVDAAVGKKQKKNSRQCASGAEQAQGVSLALSHTHTLAPHPQTHPSATAARFHWRSTRRLGWTSRHHGI